MNFTVRPISPRRTLKCAVCTGAATHTVTDRFGPSPACDSDVAQLVHEALDFGLGRMPVPFAVTPAGLQMLERAR